MPKSEHTLRVEAVVLRHSNWGEADRMLGVYSRERGRLRVVAKGARKLLSRKAGHLEPFTQVALLLAKGRDMWIVTQAETVNAFLTLREDLVRTGYAAYVVELLDRFTYDEGENRALYHLLVDTLTRIDVEEDAFLAVRYYEVRLLDLVGFRPQLQTCVHCNREIQAEDQFFSAELGGVLCPNCGKVKPSSTPVSMPVLKYMRHFQRSTYAEALRAAPKPEEQRELEALMQHYLTYLLERGLNSPDFLRRVRK